MFVSNTMLCIDPPELYINNWWGRAQCHDSWCALNTNRDYWFQNFRSSWHVYACSWRVNRLHFSTLEKVTYRMKESLSLWMHGCTILIEPLYSESWLHTSGGNWRKKNHCRWVWWERRKIDMKHFEKLNGFSFSNCFTNLYRRYNMTSKTLPGWTSAYTHYHLLEWGLLVDTINSENAKF